MELENLRFGTELLKRGFAKMQKGGVIMDVTTPEQAIIAEEAGAVAVMALHAVPADIRKMGGVARMADPLVIESIIEAVTIPVMAKARIGHFVEAQILEALGVDMVDESEVLTPADEFHIEKTKFTIPFVRGARNGRCEPGGLAYAHDPGPDQKPEGNGRSSADESGQGDRGRSGSGQGVRPDAASTGGQLRCRWGGNACRCCSHDAAGR